MNEEENFELWKKSCAMSKVINNNSENGTHTYQQILKKGQVSTNQKIPYLGTCDLSFPISAFPFGFSCFFPF